MLSSAGNSKAASSHRRGLPIALAAVSCAVAIAACGSSGSTNSGSGPTANGRYAAALAFSKCMRSHGVPNFPDPKVSGHRIQISGSSSGVNPQSPAFKSAQQSCNHLLPGGGPGSGPPSPQAKAQMLHISQCMRAHGISGFPDPKSGSPPSSKAGYSAVMGGGGYYLAIPNSIDTNSPAFKQAAAACNFG
jgi:hypothetical protein